MAGGKLAGKVYSAFTASGTAHGGQESTLLALGNVFYHWGGIIVPPGYTDPIQFKAGNPYGASQVASDNPSRDVALEAARYQARHVVDIPWRHSRPAAVPDRARGHPDRRGNR